MFILGDFHTHTKYSRHNHGKGTIIENAIAAKNKGLKAIAITDHGFNHKLYSYKRDQMQTIKKQCKEAEEKLGIKVLYGIEANFISNDGTIDLNDEDFGKLDLIIVGQHNFVKAKSIKDFFSLFLRNILSKIFPVSKKKIEKNTNVYLKALNKYKIDILSHLNYGMKVNVLKVALAAKEAGTLIELNGKRICFSEEEIKQMVNAKIKFILNSDAHSPNRVGVVNNGLNLITKLNIPHELIVNLDKLPEFVRN